MTNPAQPARGFTRRELLVGTSASLLLAPVALRAADDDNNSADALTKDDAYLTRPWATFPWDGVPYDYTFDEIEKSWDVLLRGYMIPFPSPAYLKERYARYPQMWKELKFQDEDWNMHSRNALEIWLLFFRGLYQEARKLGNEYGGFARVPALFSQLMQGVYLAPTLKEKHALLMDAVDGITYYGTVFQPRPGDDPQYRADFAMIRLGYAYGVGRIAEDVSIPTALARDYITKIMASSNDILSAYPEHPMGLALSAGISANLIRRAGSMGARLAFGATGDDAKTRFETSFALVPDQALTRYEYANMMLYVDSTSAVDDAIEQLRLASTFTPKTSVEALDIAYAKKRLTEVEDYKKSGLGFGSYDRKRRKYMNKNGENLYCVTLEPFLVSKA